MRREELIRKWLDNELSAEEFEAFKALEDYEDLVKLSNATKLFKAPEYNTSEELNTIMRTIEVQKPKLRWVSKAVKVAAVIALLFSVYYYSTTLDSTITSLAANKVTTELPDASTVSLNALSAISFNASNWDDERLVTLDGEAYFKVAKGEQFTVQTSQGKVTVLGTQFNVKDRESIFEVTCYEGSVRVDYESNSKILSPGDSFLILDGKIIAQEKETNLAPKWVANESYFKSMPFDHVLREFERQYNVSVSAEGIDVDQLFTGSFMHNDKTLALKSITLPLHLTYRIENDGSIVLKSE